MGVNERKTPTEKPKTSGNPPSVVILAVEIDARMPEKSNRHLGAREKKKGGLEKLAAVAATGPGDDPANPGSQPPGSPAEAADRASLSRH